MKRTNFRRRSQNITDYKRRLALLKSGEIRLVVRRTSRNIIAQLVDYEPEGDKVLTTVDMKFLNGVGWLGGANTPAAYLIGLEVAKRAKNLKVKKAILDAGRTHSSSKVFALVKGATERGLVIPCSKEVFPSMERCNGKQLDEYANKAKSPHFSKIKEKKVSFQENFEKVLNKIKGDKK